ncbi:MAG: DUF2304 domain-containing protein [Saprospiraceae bacterium]
MTNIDPHRIETIAIVFCLGLLLLLFRLILKRRLREEYVFVWLGVFVALTFFAVFRMQLDYFAALLGVFYAPSLLFLLFFTALLFYCLHLSIVVSKQGNQIKELAQKIALLENEVSSSNNPTE